MGLIGNSNDAAVSSEEFGIGNSIAATVSSAVVSVPLDISAKSSTQASSKTKYKMSPSSVRSEGGEAAAGYCLNSVSYRVDEAVKYNVLNSD